MENPLHHHVRHYFIPHEGNNYRPEFLHPKRAVLYGSLFVIIKAIIFIFVLLLPVQAFVLPDVLAEQGRNITALTNELRSQKDAPLNRANLWRQACKTNRLCFGFWS